MQQIGFATLYTEPRRITENKGISPLWLGDALTSNGDVRMFLKEVTFPELIAECLCATLGSALELPVLPTYIVKDPKNLLNANYLIGSEDAELPSFIRLYTAADSSQRSFLLDALCNWQHLNATALFDEWVANSDRNTGNFLWDGGDEWRLIDHGRALWSVTPNANRNEPVQNILAEIIKQHAKEIGVARLKKSLTTELPKYLGVSMANIMAAAKCSEIGCVAESQSALDSLIDRITHMPSFIARHSTQPELF